MKTQVMIMDRRQHPREGVMAEIENITYRALRKYGIYGSSEESRSTNLPEKAAA